MPQCKLNFKGAEGLDPTMPDILKDKMHEREWVQFVADMNSMIRHTQSKLGISPWILIAIVFVCMTLVTLDIAVGGMLFGNPTAGVITLTIFVMCGVCAVCYTSLVNPPQTLEEMVELICDDYTDDQRGIYFFYRHHAHVRITENRFYLEVFVTPDEEEEDDVEWAPDTAGEDKDDEPMSTALVVIPESRALVARNESRVLVAKNEGRAMVARKSRESRALVSSTRKQPPPSNALVSSTRKPPPSSALVSSTTTPPSSALVSSTNQDYSVVPVDQEYSMVNVNTNQQSLVPMDVERATQALATLNNSSSQSPSNYSQAMIPAASTNLSQQPGALVPRQSVAFAPAPAPMPVTWITPAPGPAPMPMPWPFTPPAAPFISMPPPSSQQAMVVSSSSSAMVATTTGINTATTTPQNNGQEEHEEEHDPQDPVHHRDSHGNNWWEV